MMISTNQSCSHFSIVFRLLLLMIFYSAVLPASSSCPTECGGIQIPYPFGTRNGCYLEKSYAIECRSTATSRTLVPFLSLINKEVVSISLPTAYNYYDPLSYASIRVKIPITSSGCSTGGNESAGPVMNLKGSPFFIHGKNSLLAVGCNSKVSLTHIEPNMVGCELNCSATIEPSSNSIPFFNTAGCSSEALSYANTNDCTETRPEETGCDGNGCCQTSLPNEPRQVIGIRIERNDVNSTTTREDPCRVAFLTDELYTLTNATVPRELFAKGYATVSLGWVLQTKNHSFLNSLACKNRNDYDATSEPETTCACDRSTNSEISYASCVCNKGFDGNPYDFDGCMDVDECSFKPSNCKERESCVNFPGGYRCVGSKTTSIMIGASAGFGILFIAGGLWWLRKFIIKRRMTKRKKKFFKRNGGLLLQQELNTRQRNVETTRIFSSRDLEKATENFSENRVLGHGGQGTVYKGMLVDGRTVAVKKSKVVDEDKVQEFINEVVILSQINHRHVVKLLGCCLETEVPMLVYEFILNGNLFQHIHEDSDDYTMTWGMRLRIAVDVAGALSYLHTSANVDECKIIPSICGERNTCVNTQGDFHCVGDKKKAILIGVGASFGVLALAGVVWWLRKFLIKRKITKRKKKFFKRNGGLLLQQELNTSEGNVEKTRIFSSRELEKATENFSENRVLGQGGQGTVYKGMLVDGRTVAVKKSKVIDEDKLQEFINEVVILSQINHRHVVKLLGCCLETEVPILVYQFILNGNLFQHIHEESDDYTMIWGMRLRIAVDVAGALSYLHSSASSPIYHRDIKSTNILLDEKYRAKVADFGTSRSITIDQTHWTTAVSGTVGYVDPEYYRSSQYTDKSDVYSFGVVLAELITGDKPVLIVHNTQEKISLADHFRAAMKENRLFDIMDARIKDDFKPEQVTAVANLALKCLRWKGKKRPNMREVFMELERISTSPEDSQVEIHTDEEGEEEDEDEVRNMINKGDSWSVGVTAPAFSIYSSPSSSDVEPLFPRLT
ncbi:hypothetical protein F2Q69_00033107 [Brassica cretica]|uniref:Protein kinase domain-containing protein n=1 Tax=Brassica cretica TaxID=69181 RepID=A0A8S9SKX3_BRACR|nr:hypothetical protein F2Q69_00033107 [Brassica cretica]